MKKYRIVVETQRDGKKFYYVQKRYMLIFWSYVSESYERISFKYKKYRRGFNTVEGAEELMHYCINYDNEQRNMTVVKKEVLW